MLDTDQHAMCHGSASVLIKGKGTWDRYVMPPSSPSSVSVTLLSMNDGTNLYQASMNADKFWLHQVVTALHSRSLIPEDESAHMHFITLHHCLWLSHTHRSFLKALSVKKNPVLTFNVTASFIWAILTCYFYHRSNHQRKHSNYNWRLFT